MTDTNNYPIWPGWETVRLIGRGSFGAVYEIQRVIFGDTEKAALKVISIPQNPGDVEEMISDGYDSESITDTFNGQLRSIVAEYSMMRKMNGSANVVNCDDVRYIQHENGLGWDIFIKMELLTPLVKALPETTDDVLVQRIAADICRALVLCKKYDIVHRDIKPQNIFVSRNGDYKLGDFGIAKTVERTMGGTKTGTYKYMAPEVYNNQPYGNAADIYSLGLVLHWLLNERRSPFMPLPPEPALATEEEHARLRRFQGEPIPAPKNGSEELKRIVLKACAYDVKDRYHTAEEMLADLEAIDNQFLVKELHCRECGAEYDGGKYCKFCGAKVFDPVEMIIDYRDIPVLYGPPPVFIDVECKVCHRQWRVYKEWQKKRFQKAFCPNCGKRQIIVKSRSFPNE